FRDKHLGGKIGTRMSAPKRPESFPNQGTGNRQLLTQMNTDSWIHTDLKGEKAEIPTAAKESVSHFPGRFRTDLTFSEQSGWSVVLRFISLSPAKSIRVLLGAERANR